MFQWKQPHLSSSQSLAIDSPNLHVYQGTKAMLCQTVENGWLMYLLAKLFCHTLWSLLHKKCPWNVHYLQINLCMVLSLHTACTDQAHLFPGTALQMFFPPLHELWPLWPYFYHSCHRFMSYPPCLPAFIHSSPESPLILPLASFSISLLNPVHSSFLTSPHCTFA